MSLGVAYSTIDCRNAFALSEWWRETLGYQMLEHNPNMPGDSMCVITPTNADATSLIFIEVPEIKQVKNRMHFDLRPSRDRDKEVAELVKRGATEIADHRDRNGPGTGWAVMADPEGNEFCVLPAMDQIPARTGE